MPDYPQSRWPLLGPSHFSLCVALTVPIHMSFRTSQGHRMVLPPPNFPTAPSLSFWFPILLVGPSQLSNPLLLLPSFFPSCLLQARKPDLQVCYHCMQSKVSRLPGGAQALQGVKYKSFDWSPKVFDFQSGCSQPGLSVELLALWLSIHSLAHHLALVYLGPLQSRRKAQRPVPMGRQRYKKTVEL